MRTGVPQLLDFGVTDERAWEVGLACGGKLKVFVEKLAMTPELLARLQAARAAKRPVVLATRLPDGEQLLLPDDAAPGRAGRGGRDGAAGMTAAPRSRRRARTGSCTPTTRRCGWSWSARCISRRRWCRWRPARLRRDGGRSAPRLRHRRAVSGVDVSTEWPDEAMDALRAGQPHRGRDPDP